MSLQPLTNSPFQFSLSQPNLLATASVDPITRLSDEFDLQEMNDVQTRLFFKTNGLRNEHDRHAVHNHVRAFARQLLLKLQNLRDLGATAQQLRQTGLETLRELESSSTKMIQDFERFQAGSTNLENRFSQFDARAAAPANPLTWAAFSDTSVQNSSSVSPLMGAIGQYLVRPSADQPSVLASVVQKVNRLANVSPEGTQEANKKKESPEINKQGMSELEKRKIALARCIQDEDASKTSSRPLDNTHGANVDFSSASSIMTLVQREKANQNAVTAKITAAAFHAVGYAIKETTAFALGCRSGGEREKNCRIVVGYVKTGTKKVEDGVKYAITAVGLKPAFKRAMSGKALEERLVQIGLPRESSKWYEVSARQFVRDSNTVTTNLAFVGATSAVLKIGKSLFSFPRSPFPGETWNKPSKDPTSGKKYKTYTTQGKSGPLFTDRKTYTTEPLRPEYLTRKPLLLELKQKYQLGKQAIKAASAARVTQNTAYASRFDYSADYLLHANEFINPKEFSGVLKRNLMVVQYHCSSPCHQPRTLKWFMPATQGNKLHTIEEVMNSVSKIKAFGEITQVSVARIPAGEPIKFLHGRAVSKFDSHTNVIRPGSGVQYRFYDFDPKWIVETRALPVTIPKSPIQSHLSRFLKDEGGFIKLPFSGVKEKYPEIQKFLSRGRPNIRVTSRRLD